MYFQSVPHAGGSDGRMGEEYLHGDVKEPSTSVGTKIRYSLSTCRGEGKDNSSSILCVIIINIISNKNS